MKTTLTWAGKNTGAKFNLNADCLEDALDAISKNKEWGRFEGSLDWDSKGDAAGNCSSVTVTAKYTITMPSWPALSKQPKECQEEWNRMWAALRKHEDGHLAVFEKGVADLVKKLTALKQGTHDDVSKIGQQALDSIQAGHNQYDSKTKHGQSEGVSLTIAEACQHQE